MSDETAFTHFFGEREERFFVTGKLIPELERVCGVGIGSLFKRLAEGHFRHADVIHTIRLGLIGGGMAPEHASRLCDAYATDRPISETYPLALSIMERLWLGAPVVQAIVDQIETADA